MLKSQSKFKLKENQAKTTGFPPTFLKVTFKVKDGPAFNNNACIAGDNSL